MTDTHDQNPPQQSVWSGSFMLGEIESKCHVLNDGRRIIEAESMEKIFHAMSLNPKPEEILELAKWSKGL